MQTDTKNMEEKEINIANEPDKQIVEMLGTLEAMDSVDDRALYRRVGSTIRSKQLHRRRFVLLRNAAAIILPILIATGIWMYSEGTFSESGNTQIAIVQHSGVPKLITPDGGEVVFDAGTTGQLLDQDNVTVEQQDGSLVFHKKGTEASVAQMRYYTLEVPKGARFDLILEDGTHIWLNADSRLKYPAVFAGGERRVILEGEAYFAVAHDRQKPFIVETEGQQLKVLGTEFNVSAYRDEQMVYTTLVNGRVALTASATGHETTLQPGAQARLPIGEGMFAQRMVEVDQITAWRDGVIVFENNTLEGMMRRLARIYDIDVVFEDNISRALLTRGSMPIQKDISVILRLIEASGKVEFAISGNRINIKTVN